MKTIIEKTWLPVFPGFYNTAFEPDEESEIDSIDSKRSENNLEPLEFDDLDFDYDSYRNDICVNATEYIEEMLKELGIVKSINFEKLVSPREYNFANDSINIEVELIPEKLAEYVNANFEAFEKYIKDEYSSYDGFMSNYSNDANEWKEETENFSMFGNSHQLGAVLDFVCRKYYQSKNESDEGIVIDMYYNASENAYLSVKDYDFACTKVKCPICGEWYSIEDHIDEYKNQCENELKIMNELGVKNPKVKSFEVWAKENEYKHCEY
jgi:hypothetical protein